MKKDRFSKHVEDIKTQAKFDEEFDTIEESIRQSEMQSKCNEKLLMMQLKLNDHIYKKNDLKESQTILENAPEEGPDCFENFKNFSQYARDNGIDKESLAIIQRYEEKLKPLISEAKDVPFRFRLPGEFKAVFGAYMLMVVELAITVASWIILVFVLFWIFT